MRKTHNKMTDNILSEVPFSDDEKKIMEKIIDLHNDFMKLDHGHIMEVQEWVFAIHQLQSIMEHRLLHKMFPNYFS
jgi:hypothetical protein